MTSNITWFHLNHDMVSRRIHELSIYGEGTPLHINLLGDLLNKPWSQVSPNPPPPVQLTDSTIACRPKPAISFNERSMAAQHRKGCAEKTSSMYFLSLQKDYRTMTSGWQGAPYFRSYGRELVSKLAISLKKVGGATVKPLPPTRAFTLLSRIGFSIPTTHRLSSKFGI